VKATAGKRKKKQQLREGFGPREKRMPRRTEKLRRPATMGEKEASARGRSDLPGKFLLKSKRGKIWWGHVAREKRALCFGGA